MSNSSLVVSGFLVPPRGSSEASTATGPAKRQTPARLALAWLARTQGGLRLLDFAPALGVKPWGRLPPRHRRPETRPQRPCLPQTSSSNPVPSQKDHTFTDLTPAFPTKVGDVNEFLAALPPAATRHPIRARVAYHDSCHLAHAQRIREQPRKLLAGIPGLELVEIPDGDQCCGSAGIYNLVQPESSEEIGTRKADNVLSVKPDLLASANPGCTLQIQKILRQRGLTLRAAHPIEILDASLSGRPLPG